MKLAQAELDYDGGKRVGGFFRGMLGIEYQVKSGIIGEDEVWGQLKKLIVDSRA
jgi:hypothetical protein